MIYAGDEQHGHWQTSPELEDQDDPMGYPCEECGDEAGEDCRPYCTAMPG